MGTSDTPAEKPDERAMEEWKQLETIIGRFEGQEFQVRSWLFVLLGVLGAALLAERPRLSGPVFAAVAGGLVWVHCAMELVIRIPKRKAYERVAEIERALRGEAAYDGPRIGMALDSGRTRPKMYWAEFRKSRVWFFYASLFVLVLIFGLASS